MLGHLRGWPAYVGDLSILHDSTCRMSEREVPVKLIPVNSDRERLQRLRSMLKRFGFREPTTPDSSPGFCPYAGHTVALNQGHFRSSSVRGREASGLLDVHSLHGIEIGLYGSTYFHFLCSRTSTSNMLAIEIILLQRIANTTD